VEITTAEPWFSPAEKTPNGQTQFTQANFPIERPYAESGSSGNQITPLESVGFLTLPPRKPTLARYMLRGLSDLPHRLPGRLPGGLGLYRRKHPGPNCNPFVYV
jgi:hypothetical protein